MYKSRGPRNLLLNKILEDVNDNAMHVLMEKHLKI